MTQIDSYLIRERVIKAARHFFDQQQFHEVMVPVLNKALPIEPNLYPFVTKWHKFDQTQKLYLPCSPESALKKSLAREIEPCYALAPAFRNLEPVDLEHNPEFLMLEWYRAESDYQQIMEDCQNLIKFVTKKIHHSQVISYQAHQLDLAKDWPVFSLATIFEQVTEVKLEKVSELTEIKQLANQLGYRTKNSNWEQLFNQIVINLIEPKLPTSPCFLIDFPLKISPLCQAQSDRPFLAQRFELYLAGLELANGNNEQTDVDLVKAKFEQEQQSRQKCQLPVQPLDQDFLKALNKMSKSQYAGVGLGIDRLAMILANETNLSAVNPSTL